MMFIFFILLILIGMFLKKSKCYNFIIIIFIVIISYYNVIDVDNYQRSYDYIANGNYYNDLGEGWYHLCKIGSILDLSYIQFKTIIIILSFILINSSIKYFIKDNKYKPIVFALYLIFPALLDCIQVRFFIAEAISLFSLRFLYSDKKKDAIIYIIIILLTSTIHSSVLFYLIFLLYKVMKTSENKYIAIITTIMFVLGAFKEYIIRICALFVNQQRIERYFYSDDKLGIKGFIIYVVIVLVFYYFSKAILKNIKNMDLDEKEIKFYNFVTKLNILISLILIFSMFDPNFFRIQRIMWILMYISVAKLLNNNVKDIVFLKVRMPLILVAILFAILGNLTFISITTPEIITNLLL